MGGARFAEDLRAELFFGLDEVDVGGWLVGEGADDWFVIHVAVLL